MELIIRPNKEHIQEYVNSNITNFLLPLKNFSVDSFDYFTFDNISKIRENYPQIHLFVSMNKNFQNNDIDEVKEQLVKLNELKISGIFFYDVTLLQLKEELNLDMDFIWNQTHMVTNLRTCNYYYSKDVKYGVFAPEITLDEMIHVSNETTMSMMVNLLYYPKVAFSNRSLVTNYYKSIEKKAKDRIVVDEKVSKQKYTIIENQEGTSFVLNDFVNGLIFLEEFMNSNIKYAIIYEEIEFEKIVKAINAFYKFKEEYQEKNFDKDRFIKEQKELLGEYTGFFEKKTIYKVKRS